MTIEREDRRIRRTQDLLARALIALTLEKGYDAVTIRDITTRADIGYATFFRHYHDKEALLDDVSDVVLAELIEQLGPMHAETDQIEVGTRLFRYVQEQHELVRVLAGRTSTVQRIVAATPMPALESSAGSQSVVPAEIARFHIVSATIALIGWWLDHAMPYPPERMGRIYAALIANPTQACIF